MDQAESRKCVAVTGASGFVGRALVAALQERGHHVIALGRSPQTRSFSPAVDCRQFDPGGGAPNPRAFDGADAVIHLAGEPVDGRWTGKKKAAILSSRVDGTRTVLASIAACSRRPASLISASAVGYYGSRGDEPLVESSPPGNTFLAHVCTRWERETQAATQLGLRAAYLRIGIVLGKGGALGRMSLPFRFGVGGPFGSGRQFVPWIHIDDLARMFVFVLEHDELRGPVNAVAPDYSTSSRFAQALGAAMKRVALAPAPAFALRMVLGEFADTILASQLVIPAIAEDAGFSWNFPRLESAMIDVIAQDSRQAAATHRFRSEQFVRTTLDEAFAFFSDPENLERITPPALRFSITSRPLKMGRGSLITYNLRLRGFPLRWKTMIACWLPKRQFIDVQLRGPYAFWQHQHDFEEVEGGVILRDQVEYALPFAPLSNIALGYVRSDIEAIFRHRRDAIAQMVTVQDIPSKAGEAPPPRLPVPRLLHEK